MEFCWDKSKLCEGWLSKGDSDMHYMCNNGLSQGQHWGRTAWLQVGMKYEGTHGRMLRVASQGDLVGFAGCLNCVRMRLQAYGYKRLGLKVYNNFEFIKKKRNKGKAKGNQDENKIYYTIL